MKSMFGKLAMAGAAALFMLPSAQGQSFDCTPVDLSDYFNSDGWYDDVADEPAVPTNHPDGGTWTLDSGTTQRIQISTLPEDVIPGQVNLTADGEVEILLPEMVGVLDVYYPVGNVIEVPEGNYKYAFFAMMSGSGNWPGNETQWGPEKDPDTGELIDQRVELNSFKPIYADGEGDSIQIGVVNDWFWEPPVWVAPVSGDPEEIVQQYKAYEGDPNGLIYLWEGVGQTDHDFGQYTYCNGEGNYFVYYMDGYPNTLDGLTEATLWVEMWGNVKFSISSDGVNYTEMYNSATEDQIYTAPAGNLDGFQPNLALHSFDLAPFLANGDVTELYYKFEDAAPDNAVDQENNPWGPRVRNIGIFTGEVEETSLGARLWPNLVRYDGASPPGGLILIRKQYRLDESRTLTGLQMPNDLPHASPILSFFGITLANDKTEVEDYMLH